MPTVFIDFDGTITEDETFVAVLKHFAPERSAELIPQMLDEQVTLRVGVRQILQSIPSARFPEILAFVADARLRPGFAEFLQWLAEQHVPAIVVSGGLTAIVAQRLAPYQSLITAIHAVDVDLSGPMLHPHTPFEGGTELLEKVAVVDSAPTDFVVTVGDSLTDVQLSQRADLAFARGRLQSYLDARSCPYVPWEDFHDVRTHLASLWSAQ